jgi:hypothetical protein
MPNQTIVELAAATKDLSTLVAALKAGDLVKTLSAPGQWTVFAPTNEAFAALPANVLSALLKPENKGQLVKVLSYHLAFPEVHSDQLKDGEKILMQEGDNVTVSLSGKSVKINNATVTSADNQASNGVVHIIDQVLLYPGFAPPAPPVPPATPAPSPAPLVPGRCPFTAGAVCCNSTLKQLCPGGVECPDCGAEACECPDAVLLPAA